MCSVAGKHFFMLMTYSSNVGIINSFVDVWDENYDGS
jgi:hypothetical protein